MKDNRLRSLYYGFTFLLCACAGLSAEALIGKLYFSIFLLGCGLGILFSSQATIDTKKNLRNIFGWILLIGLPVFFWKIPLQQSTLPNLIKIFILLIIASCYIIENASMLSLVHFECIFITIFSACLPFIIHPRYQVALFSLGLFLIVVLLQITQIRFSADNQASQYVITNVSIPRRFILSFMLCLAIIGIGSLIFFIVPKYSFQLDFDLQGSSFVDFKLKPKSNLRLMMPYQSGEKELSQDQVVPYVRSLFVKPNKDENLMSFEANKWKQPLIIKEKKKEKIINSSIKQGNNKKGLVSEGKDISSDDKQEALLTKVLDNPNAKLQSQIKNLENKIAKDKKLYDFLSFMGRDDPIQAGRANQIAQTIKQEQQKLGRLKKEVNQNQGQSEDARPADNQGSGKIGFLAKLAGFGKNNDEKESQDGNDSGEQGAGESKQGKGEGSEGSGEGSGKGAQGSGEGAEGAGKGNDGSGVGEEGAGKGKDGSGAGEEGAGKNNDGSGEGADGAGKGKDGTSEGADGIGQGDDGTMQGEQGTSYGKQSENKEKDNGENLAKNNSENQSDSNSNNNAEQISQDQNSQSSESGQGDASSENQQDGKSEQSQDSKNPDAAEQKTSQPDSKQNDNSDQKEVNDEKGDFPGVGGGTNSNDNKGESQGSGAGGKKGGTQGGDSAGSASGGKGKADGASKGSGGAGTAGGQGDDKGAGSEGNAPQGNGTGKSDSPGENEKDEAKDSKGSSESAGGTKHEKQGNTTLTSYLFKFEDKPLSSFRKWIAAIARGNVPKKELSSLVKKNQEKPDKQDQIKEHKKPKQKKLEEPAVVNPEPLSEEKTADSSNNFFWYLFIFFAVLFCGGICWACLYLIFCIIRKISRDLKLRYLLVFKLNQIIFYLYRNLLFVFKKTGLISQEFLTPKEIGNIAVKKYNISKEAIDAITNVFEQSRYSNHKIDVNNISACIKAYNALKIDIIKDNTLLKKLSLKLDMLSVKNRRKS
ncbi:MAG: hypothetical protein V1747_00170 [Candidatus Omnitrophota bacterium]